MSKERFTQAVIFIHGIGEQVPMGTVRGFVEGVLPEQDDGIQYFSRPDDISATYELRILQDRNQPRTHFFEYYWAHKVEGTNFGHIFSWLKSLLLRWPTEVNDQLIPLWFISWALILIAGLAFAFGFINADSFKFSGIAAMLFSILQGYILNWAGDAARYLSPTPKNISLRQAIRKDGIDLVKKIMQTKKYERIIIVGHSLGSVIGYDILKHLWQEYNLSYLHLRESLQDKTKAERDKLKKKDMQPALLALEKFDQITSENLEAYREAQIKLWQENRSMGNPWLVTDFITLGSPLTHAVMLLAKDNEDLGKRRMQRELPTNPPVPDHVSKVHAYSYDSDFWHTFKDEKNKIFTPWVIHHAGLFAFTRWTNFYFPVKWGLFGDLVGGPLRPWFGAGIKDITVRTGKWWRDWTLAAHSSYWLKKKSAGENPPYLQALIDALDLNNFDIFKFEGYKKMKEEMVN